MTDGIDTSEGGQGGSSPVFVKGFLPGLLVGLVVGLTLGAVVPPLLEARGSLSDDEAAPAPSSAAGREGRDAFEGTGLPLEDESDESEDASSGEAAPPPTD